MGIVDINIHKILKDKNHAYWSRRDDQAHRDAVAEMSRLYAQKEQESRHGSGRTSSVDSSNVLILTDD